MKMFEKLLNSRYLSSWIVLLVDLVMVAISSVISIYAVRFFSGGVAVTMVDAIWMFAGSVVINLIFFLLFRTYRHVVRHLSLKGLLSLGVAMFSKAVVFYVLLKVVPSLHLGIKSIILGVSLDFLISMVALVSARVMSVSSMYVLTGKATMPSSDDTRTTDVSITMVAIAVLEVKRHTAHSLVQAMNHAMAVMHSR